MNIVRNTLGRIHVIYNFGLMIETTQNIAEIAFPIFGFYS